MALLDLLGRRWALRILWELRDDTGPTFRALQARCDGISSSVLTARMKDLHTAALATHDGSGYHLTPEGHRLLAYLEPLAGWADRWNPKEG